MHGIIHFVLFFNLGFVPGRRVSLALLEVCFLWFYFSVAVPNIVSHTC